MTAPEICCGDAIDYPGTGPTTNVSKRHTHVVVKIEDGDLFLLPVSSEIQNHDPTCPLKVGEGWDAIIKESFIAYYHAKKVPLYGAISNIENGIILYRGAIPEHIYKRIIDGISTSPDTEPWFKNAIFPPQKKNILRAPE